ncbi:chemotaxis protein CheC [Lentibacillus saliphilus]|uniref:chemotaxis protein CheC n=1 Tax=Lentibacillus saliphilus TaxID=2737028 RepID=UPI001C30F66D|nr:chemotaxis protein CheC [Lentibacillus saliphilus]
MVMNHLSNVQRDVLKEIGNIGAGNAATAMAQLIDKKIEMAVPVVNIAAFDEVMDIVGGPETPAAAVLITIDGDVTGKVYFILPIEEAEFIVEQVTGDDNFKLLDNGSAQSMGLSALQEVGNILTGSYLSALSDFTGLNMHPSVPHLGVDMAGAILASGLIDLSQWSDYAIIIDTQIRDKSGINSVQGHFLLLPDPISFNKIFNALGVNDDDE